MRRSKNQFSMILFVFCLVAFSNNIIYADDGYDLWMKYNKINDKMKLQEYQQTLSYFIYSGDSKTGEIIKKEIQKGMGGLLGEEVFFRKAVTQNGAVIICTLRSCGIVEKLNLTLETEALGKEGFLITSAQIDGYHTIVIAANDDVDLLYGTFHLLRLVQSQKSLKNINIISKPKIQYRLLNHWDNLDRSVERGYAGKSLWKWDELPGVIDPRYTDYARANASIGINGTVINNVNATPQILTPEYIEKITVLANVFRPYGIKLYLSINFSSPLKPSSDPNSRRGGIGDLDTSDPLNPEVRLWWKNKVKEIYASIPDFGGFLVKANSEGMPGPQDYGRTQAEGANMLAGALSPYNGIVMWRAFVYNAEVDADRAKRAYKEFVPLDGNFSENVFVQAKNGPIDFQPREPVHPLFGGLPQTPVMPELQITQEYLGHSKHLVYLAPMWQEYLQFDTFAKGEGSTVAKIIDGSVYNYRETGIAGVTNIGDDRNWCGHLFAQANWYSFGRLAWDHTLTAEEIADEWIKMTLSQDSGVVKRIKTMMMGSREACVNYMTPLGLHHIMQEGFHYGPQPDFANSRTDWTSVYYHRADSLGLGFDRSSSGSNATGQYFPPVRDMFDDIDTCPEKYLLWFHHVSWDRKMKSGRTLWDELCYRYYSGVNYVKEMRAEWQALENNIDPGIFVHVQNKLKIQEQDATIWRDTCVTYFQKFSKKPVPVFGTGYEGPKTHNLD